MRAITTIPQRVDSAKVEEVPEPPASDGQVLVETLAVGFCRTDIGIVAGNYGAAPEGRARIVLGHESVGRVLDAPQASDVAVGDLVAGVVRHPDPQSCCMCKRGRYDLCENDMFVERGIAHMDGYASERFRSRPEFLVKLKPSLGLSGVLVEPGAVVFKAWERLNSVETPRTAAVIGAGPVGVLAALLGAGQGVLVHLVDQVSYGIKPRLARRLGVTYTTDLVGTVRKADAVLECSGSDVAVANVFRYGKPSQMVCLTGISSGSRKIDFNCSVHENSAIRLDNRIVIATVSAHRNHYQGAASALASADRSFVAEIITGSWPISQWSEALKPGPDCLKSIIEFRN